MFASGRCNGVDLTVPLIILGAVTQQPKSTSVMNPNDPKTVFWLYANVTVIVRPKRSPVRRRYRTTIVSERIFSPSRDDINYRSYCRTNGKVSYFFSRRNTRLRTVLSSYMCRTHTHTPMYVRRVSVGISAGILKNYATFPQDGNVVFYKLS